MTLDLGAKPFNPHEAPLSAQETTHNMEHPITSDQT